MLLDTHTWVWSFLQPSLLSPLAKDTISRATNVYVPPCVFHEIASKHRSGKWPEVGPFIHRLPQIMRSQGAIAAPYSIEMAILSGGIDWPHKDPFDRMIAATAIELSCPLISKDPAFDELTAFPGWPGRIWAAS